MNVADQLQNASRLFPDKAALLFEGATFSYRDVDGAANRIAGALRALGVVEGERVALYLPNIPEFVFAYFGIQKLGAIAVSLNVTLKRPEVEFILDDCGATVLVTTSELRANLPPQAATGIRHVLIAEGDAEAGELGLAALTADAEGQGEAVQLEPADPAAILYTSGTTGFPKGATLSHGNIVSNMHSVVYNCGVTPDDRLLLFLPLFHCFGQNFILNGAFAAAACVVLQRRFAPEPTQELLEKSGVTMFFGVPTNYILYLNSQAPAASFASVRYYFSAAAALPVEISTAWQKRFGRVIHEGYGLTETSPFASYNHRLRFKSGSIGTPLENVEMKVVDEAGDTVPDGQWGEILIRGPNVMLGYWNRPEDTAAVIEHGWFHSGDIGERDADGYFYICDRLKDMIISSGFNVYPAEVENAIYGHPSVAEAAVYGIPDSTKGELVKASVVCKPGARLSAEEVIAFCQERLANYKVPRVVDFVDGIPKSPTGKILKRLLREADAAS